MIFEESRYEACSIVPIADATGTYHATIIPLDATVSDSFTTVRTSDGDRFDTLAQAAYGDPEYWWVIADSNPQLFYPDELPTGTLVMVPTAVALS